MQWSSYICLVSDDAKDGRHDDEVYEVETGGPRRPAEVLVSVRGHGCWGEVVVSDFVLVLRGFSA